MTLPTPRAAADASDRALVCRVADGDAAALEALYDRYGGPAFALARQVAGEPACAEDVVRAVFLELWRDPERYDPAVGGLASWLLASTHHKAVEAMRRDGTARTGPGFSPNRLSPARLDGDQPRGDRVRGALGGLPAPQRETLLLAYYAGRTQREIAEQTGTPLGTVRAHLLAGMRQLRTLLDRSADPDRPDEPDPIAGRDRAPDSRPTADPGGAW